MDIVEKFCGFLAPDWGEFLDFIHLKGKIFHGGTVRRRAGRPEVAPGGLRRDFSGSGQRDFPGTPDVGNRGTKSGIPVSCQSEQEVVLRDFTRNLQQQEGRTAADSCGLC